MICLIFVLVLLSSTEFSISLIINNRPIIGVTAQEVWKQNGTSEIYASYVKFIESAGARVVPIWIHKPRSYYEDILSKLNGVLFPGGGDIISSDGYGRTGRIIYDIATKMNDAGHFFPLWGTCLGFEMMNFLVAKKLWMKACSAEDLPTTIDFVKDFRTSKLFNNLDGSLANVMQNKDTVIHFHQWCLTPQNYTLSGLDKYFKVLAVNKDSRNMTFVSIVEAHNYPFYGVSFHPEKVSFEWVLSKTHLKSPHSTEATRVSQYFGNFFVNEARKSNHSFPSVESERAALIYNYNPVYAAKDGKGSIEQIYFFKQ